MTSTQSSELLALATLLNSRFSAKHIDAMLQHHGTMIAEFQKGEWEKCILRAGKLVEAVLKALWVLPGNPLPRSRDFKVDFILRELERVPKGTADDTIRLTIPRACRFIYDIASNRGARHDPDEIDPNVMDASVVVSSCAWVIAEMLRYSQKGLNPSKAQEFVQSLSQKRFSLVEEVDGRLYFHVKHLSARSTALLTLWQAYPGRVHRDHLLVTVKRHGFSTPNAQKGVSRLRRLVDDDGRGNLRLLAPGMEEADGLITSGNAYFDS